MFAELTGEIGIVVSVVVAQMTVNNIVQARRLGQELPAGVAEELQLTNRGRRTWTSATR